MKTMEKTTLADKYVTFSEESKKLLHPELIEVMSDTFNKVYPGICNFFNNGEIRNVVFEADPNHGFPSLTTTITTIVEDDDNGVVIKTETKIENNTIKFNPNDIVCKGGIWDVGWMIHELIHIAQDYKYYEGNYPSWIVEGLADYGTEKVGLYNKESSWRIRQISNNKNYEIGYTIAAGFFIWIEKNIDATLPKNLNNTMKLGKYTDNYFIERTGKTVEELWQMYVEENRANFIIWLEKHIGISLPKDIHDKLKSGELDDELENYIHEKTGKSIDDLSPLWIIYEDMKK